MWIVMTSTASNRGGYGPYANIALVKLTQWATARDYLPSRIDVRDRRRIVRIEHWGKSYVGGLNSAHAMRLHAARAEVERRNNHPTEADFTAWGGSA